MEGSLLVEGNLQIPLVEGRRHYLEMLQEGGIRTTAEGTGVAGLGTAGSAGEGTGHPGLEEEVGTPSPPPVHFSTWVQSSNFVRMRVSRLLIWHN